MPSLLASELSSEILIHTYVDHVSVFIPAAPNRAKQCWSAGRMPSFNIMLSVLCCVVVQYRDGDLWRLWCQDSSLCRLRLTEHIQHLASSQFLKTTVATRRLALAWPCWLLLSVTSQVLLRISRQPGHDHGRTAHHQHRPHQHLHCPIVTSQLFLFFEIPSS